MIVGELINILRKEKGFGVLDLARRLAISRVSLFRIERGQRQPSEKTAIAALKILGLTEEQIYQVFVFNDLVKRGAISRKSKETEVKSFLKRLKKNTKEATLLHRYFLQVLSKK